MGSFKEKVLAKVSEEEEKKERRERFVRKVVAELPGVVESVLVHFSEACRGTPIEISSEGAKLELVWAYDGSKLGEVNVRRLTLKLRGRHLSIALNPEVGYIGATAKIDLETKPILARPQWPMQKGELFVSIGREAGEPNDIFYLAKDGRSETFKGKEKEVVDKILSAVFLAER